MKSIIKKIDELLNEKDYVVVAIDGCAASGKTTLAKELQRHYNCEIIKMDHFFLPPQKRTMERLNTPGGNIDYERFKEEVIDKLGSSFSYHVFDCSVMALNGVSYINNNRLTIIEGSYSLHPYFGKYYDLSIFLDIDYEEQIRRIKKRNGEEMLKMFTSKWIKYETLYHDEFNIKNIVDIYKMVS
jgi:uridine kinase